MKEGKYYIEDICSWNDNSMNILYDHYYSALVSYVMQKVNIGTAEDIVQELFSSLWERRPSFASLASLKAYLYNSVHNAIANSIRHSVVHDNYAQEFKKDQMPFVVTDDGHESFFTEEIYRQLFMAIDQLPKRQREIFLMSMEGKKNREIAEALDISAETVKLQKRRAIAALRQKLSPNIVVIILCLALSSNLGVQRIVKPPSRGGHMGPPLSAGLTTQVNVNT